MVKFMVEQREGSNQRIQSPSKLEMVSLAETGCLEDSETEEKRAQV